MNELNPDKTLWYYLNDVYPAIQGEGIQTGIPMILIRLMGCEVGCPWCDTKETWEMIVKDQVPTIENALGRNPRFTHQPASEIVCYLTREFPAARWVLITGGEPADQNLFPLVEELKKAGYLIALETSGTATGHLSSPIDHVTVSPKFNMPGKKPVLPEVVNAADEIKHVIGKYTDVEELETFLRKNRIEREGKTICLQPVSQSKKATRIVIELALQRGYRISIQLHKILNLP